jgi:hypothetical protein
MYARSLRLWHRLFSLIILFSILFSSFGVARIPAAQAQEGETATPMATATATAPPTQTQTATDNPGPKFTPTLTSLLSPILSKTPQTSLLSTATERPIDTPTSNASMINVLSVTPIATALLTEESSSSSEQESRSMFQIRSANEENENIEWQLIGPTGDKEVLAMAIDPNQSQDLFVATRNGVYRSMNGGTSWEKVLTGFFREIAISQDATIYTGPHGPSAYGIYKSVDNGDNWNFYKEGMTCTNLATIATVANDADELFIGSF